MRHFIGNRAFGPFLHHDPDDFGDDVARFSQPDLVSNPNVLFPDLVLIVQGGTGHRASSDADGLEHGVRSQDTGTAHRDGNVQQAGLFLFRGVLVRNGPSRRLAGGAEAGSLFEAIHLHHRPIDFVGQIAPAFPDGGDGIPHGRRVTAQRPAGTGLETHPGEICQGFGMGFRNEPFRGRPDLLDVENDDIQVALRCHGGFQLPERTSRRVARIGEDFVAIGFLLFIQLQKVIPGHEYFPAHLQIFRDDGRLFRNRDAQRDTRHGPQIGRHIFADIAVPAGRTARKQALLIFEGNRKPIHFPLHDIFHVATGGFAYPGIESRDCFPLEYVIEAFHADQVRDFSEIARRPAADTL